MTLCPLQFPWDTVPLLPSSSELRGTRLTYQNCFFFFSPEKVWVETMLAQLARAGFRQGAQYESLGKGELCISLTAFHCCEGTQRKVFISAKIRLQGQRPLSSGNLPSLLPPLPSRRETPACHFHVVRPTPDPTEPALLLKDPSCCTVRPSGWDAAAGAKLKLMARAIMLARWGFLIKLANK